jgi:hypothetical protein
LKTVKSLPTELHPAFSGNETEQKMSHRWWEREHGRRPNGQTSAENQTTEPLPIEPHPASNGNETGQKMSANGGTGHGKPTVQVKAHRKATT